MDEIYKLGLTSLFVEIGMLVTKKFKIDTKYAQLDTTSFHLQVEYKSEETAEKNEKIIQQRPKNICIGQT